MPVEGALERPCLVVEVSGPPDARGVAADDGDELGVDPFAEDAGVLGAPASRSNDGDAQRLDLAAARHATGRPADRVEP